jgi:hypothetical protein
LNYSIFDSNFVLLVKKVQSIDFKNTVYNGGRKCCHGFQDTAQAGLIEEEDPGNNSRKFVKYIPIWALFYLTGKVSASQEWP